MPLVVRSRSRHRKNKAGDRLNKTVSSLPPLPRSTDPQAVTGSASGSPRLWLSPVAPDVGTSSDDGSVSYAASRTSPISPEERIERTLAEMTSTEAAHVEKLRVLARVPTLLVQSGQSSDKHAATLLQLLPFDLLRRLVDVHTDFPPLPALSLASCGQRNSDPGFLASLEAYAEYVVQWDDLADKVNSAIDTSPGFQAFCDSFIASNDEMRGVAEGRTLLNLLYAPIAHVFHKRNLLETLVKQACGAQHTDTPGHLVEQEGALEDCSLCAAYHAFSARVRDINNRVDRQQNSAHVLAMAETLKSSDRQIFDQSMMERRFLRQEGALSFKTGASASRKPKGMVQLHLFSDMLLVVRTKGSGGAATMRRDSVSSFTPRDGLKKATAEILGSLFEISVSPDLLVQTDLLIHRTRAFRTDTYRFRFQDEAACAQWVAAVSRARLLATAADVVRAVRLPSTDPPPEDAMLLRFTLEDVVAGNPSPEVLRSLSLTPTHPRSARDSPILSSSALRAPATQGDAGGDGDEGEAQEEAAAAAEAEGANRSGSGGSRDAGDGEEEQRGNGDRDTLVQVRAQLGSERKARRRVTQQLRDTVKRLDHTQKLLAKERHERAQAQKRAKPTRRHSLAPARTAPTGVPPQVVGEIADDLHKYHTSLVAQMALYKRKMKAVVARNRRLEQTLQDAALRHLDSTHTPPPVNARADDRVTALGEQLDSVRQEREALASTVRALEATRDAHAVDMARVNAWMDDVERRLGHAYAVLPVGSGWREKAAAVDAALREAQTPQAAPVRPLDARVELDRMRALHAQLAWEKQEAERMATQQLRELEETFDALLKVHQHPHA